MKRREFVATTGCGLTAFLATNPTLEAQPAQKTVKPTEKTTQPAPKRWKIEFEIFEARADSWCHKKGGPLGIPRGVGQSVSLAAGQPGSFRTSP